MRYDLKHLSTFVAVAEELNFHRAAERLTMAQPAVSRVVLELEDRLGVKLLERTTRKVRLTESGRYLLEEAQEILSRIDMAENTVRLLASGTKAILQDRLHDHHRPFAGARHHARIPPVQSRTSGLS